MLNEKTNVVLSPEYMKMAKVVMAAHPDCEDRLARVLRQCLRLEYERIIAQEKSA